MQASASVDWLTPAAGLLYKKPAMLFSKDEIMTSLTSLKHRLLLVICGLTLMPALASAASDAGTLLVGKLVVGSPCISTLYGYNPGNYGSYSPTGLTGGQIVGTVTENHTCATGFVSAILAIGGFTSDPGKTWLTSITCNGVTLTSGSSSAYGYGSGTSQWTWSATGWGLSGHVNSNVSCTITHN
jgi:hypothetical protein